MREGFPYYEIGMKEEEKMREEEKKNQQKQEEKEGFMRELGKRAKKLFEVLSFVMVTTFGQQALMARERVERPLQEAARTMQIVTKEQRERGSLNVFYVEGKTPKNEQVARLRVIERGDPKNPNDDFMCEGRFYRNLQGDEHFEMSCGGDFNKLPGYRKNVENVTFENVGNLGFRDLSMGREMVRNNIATLAELRFLKNGTEMVGVSPWVKKMMDERYQKAKEKFEKNFPGIDLQGL